MPRYFAELGSLEGRGELCLHIFEPIASHRVIEYEWPTLNRLTSFDDFEYGAAGVVYRMGY